MVIHETVPQRMRTRVHQHGYQPMLYFKNETGEFVSSTFADVWKSVVSLGCALRNLGVKAGDHVGIMSDNRPEWLVADLAIMGLGAADVPRGSDSTAEEMTYILRHADCRITIAENPRQCEKILGQRDQMPKLEIIVLLDDYDSPDQRPKAIGITFATYAQLLTDGQAASDQERQAFEKTVDAGKPDDLATLLYTSGTTGEPKGVMLYHRAFIFQMDRIEKILHLTPSDIFISVLPIWHSFERAVEYIALNYGASLAYSKPVGQVLLADMAKIRPTWMTSVPRIWEGIRAAVFRNVAKQSPVKQALFHFFVGIGEIHTTVSNLVYGRMPQFQKRSRLADFAFGIIPWLLLYPLRALGNVLVFKSLKERLGGRFVAGVSGGGALPPYVDQFFQAAGILVLEGYGLTETGPVLAVRHQDRPIPGTVGPLLPDIESRIMAENGSEVGPGEKGVLWVKSPQIMGGYYKKPEETEKVLQDGWLNTGDICSVTYDGEIRILGRAKETIVLLGGENVEPTPIEETILQSEYIDQVMVVGQDKKFLGALVVPNQEKMLEFAQENDITYVEQEEIIESPRFQEKIHAEIQRLVNRNTGFKPFEQIFRQRLLPSHFEVGKELTQTMKIRRSVVTDMYRHDMEKMYES